MVSLMKILFKGDCCKFILSEISKTVILEMRVPLLHFLHQMLFHLLLLLPQTTQREMQQALIVMIPFHLQNFPIQLQLQLQIKLQLLLLPFQFQGLPHHKASKNQVGVLQNILLFWAES